MLTINDALSSHGNLDVCSFSREVLRGSCLWCRIHAFLHELCNAEDHDRDVHNPLKCCNKNYSKNYRGLCPPHRVKRSLSI